MAEVTLEMQWAGDNLIFKGGRVDGPQVTIDGNGATAVSPVQSLLLALASCMGSDVVDILTKMRVPLSGLSIRAEGDRVADSPRRYSSITLSFRTSGVTASDESKVQRALELSREKYCSVLHSLRSDIAFAVNLQLS